MLFQYVGDNNEAPERTTLWGYTFVLHGAAVDVPDGSREALKLKTHKCFRAVVCETRQQLDLAEPAVYDAAPTDDDKAAFYLERLTAAGARVDGRWGLARLAREYAALGAGNGAD